MTAIVIAIAPLCYAASYGSYTYDYWGDPVDAPQAYLPEKVINGAALGTIALKEPMDMTSDSNGNIYIADSGNGRILVLNQEYRLIKEIRSFKNNGADDTFVKPQGVFVGENGHVFVADTENGRIVELDAAGELVRIIGAPESELFGENFVYKPMKLVVDKAGRFHIVAQNMNKGLLELDADGAFVGFFGAIKVFPNMLEYMWKMVATEEIKSKMQNFVPTEYNNISIDKDGFLYVTTNKLDADRIRDAVVSRRTDDSVAVVRKLAPSEDDVLRRHGVYPPVGDVSMQYTGIYGGMSQISDVTVEDSGIYSLLDLKKGRIFTYDNDGNFMYVFGFIGNSLGNFRNPVALVNSTDGDILVLDSQLNHVTVFKITEYGTLLKKAVTLHYQGDYTASAEKWEQVLRFNANNDLAYIGMGKAMLRQDRYREAMDYFRAGNSREYYTRAFKLYRKEWFEENINYIIAGVVVLAVGVWIFGKYRKRRCKKEA